MTPTELTVETGDISDFRADVIVLKYAQSFYGADALVAETLRQGSHREPVMSPAPGDFALVPTRGLLPAEHALFLGVVPLFQFEYPEIRVFATQALQIIQDELPEARHVAMTMHGVGYGLDEREAFLAQVAGLLDGLQETAIRSPPAAPAVRRITIVEQQQARARRLSAILEEVRPPARNAVTRTPQRGPRPTPARIDAGAASQKKPHVFVAMPFSKELEDVFVFGIQGPVHAAGFLCERVDMAVFTGDILDRIQSRIRTAALVIADLTGANANVYLEVGYAWGTGRPTLLLVRSCDDLKFDVRGQRCIIYENIVDLARKLERDLAEFTGT
jgi:hypothetical protein